MYYMSKRRNSRPKYLVRVIRTRYWRPGSDYIKAIIKALKRAGVRNGDVVVLSEKAISVAKGNIVDESKIRPSLMSKLLARIWMRIIWGYILGPMSRLSTRTIHNLRRYPLELGARHKQLVLMAAGPLQALCFGSEGGIDASNVPYAYVCLPLRNPEEEAKRIAEAIKKALRRRVIVMIVDSDRCYTWRSLHISPRPTSFKGIKSLGGFITYVICNMLRLKANPTPIAISDDSLTVEEALEIASIAERRRGHGAGRDVWEMAARFRTSLDGVTWEMLESIPHYPIVVVRRLRKKAGISTAKSC
ncbi:MAG: gamma-glutamyl ligase [Thermoprotei archaeon]|nr:MAG: gamma-glutamyl ligase [Thermoprotei archaeon]RLF24644.1 MAG: gamma-glutamyl ligase [Thermoprotei archaeon]